jgi:hypothetical protein
LPIDRGTALTGKTRRPRSKNIGGKNMKLKVLVGSGDKIGLLTLPFLIIGLILNILFPSLFNVGGPSIVLKAISIIVLIPGITIWIGHVN